MGCVIDGRRDGCICDSGLGEDVDASKILRNGSCIVQPSPVYAAGGTMIESSDTRQ